MRSNILIKRVKILTWTFDYTVTFAVISIIVAFTGALIYFFGAHIGIEIKKQFNQKGYITSFNKDVFFNNSITFFWNCIVNSFELKISNIIILFIIFIIIYFSNFIYLYISSFFQLNTLNILFNVFVYIVFFILLYFQYKSYKWARDKYYKYVNLDSTFFSGEIYTKSRYSFILFTFVSYFIINISNSVLDGSISLICFVFYFSFSILIPLVFILITLSELSSLAALNDAKSMLSEHKLYKKFIIHLINNQKVEGNKLSYFNGIYTLTTVITLTNTEISNDIYEDKIVLIERFEQ
jgi:hypothetical protein